MNRDNEITMPPDILERASQWARVVVSDYQAGLHSASRAVSSHGAESNVGLQMRGKLAEVAFAVWVGKSPFSDVYWGRGPDPGYDISVSGKRIDVKWSSRHARYLIWPMNKRHLYDSKRFDAFVMVRGWEPTFEISRWVTKGEFASRHLIAGKDHKLTEGTWYLPLSDCPTMESFAAYLSEAA